MIVINEEVQKALVEKKAVVALESTIISHGMPFPENLEMAKKVENIIREQGAVPATIAIIDGVIRVGLCANELELFAKNKEVIKVSKRDIAYVVSKKKTGATTVSATMIIAKMAGIEVFATGGIGGVHRGGEKTFDISRDLEELATTSVTVVCAGVKSILDMGLTLEYLETAGVEVIGYKTNKLPAFYTSQSDFEINIRLENANEIASLIKAKRDLHIDGGILVTNPIPEEYGLDGKEINKTIEKALERSNHLGITGKDITPFLLNEVKNMTKGQSLQANLELVYNNAYLAAQIATELSKISVNK